MEEKRIELTSQHDTQSNILSCIVDAMLDAESDLRDATVEQWTRTLVQSCRRQKQLYADHDVSIASTC